ncbi:hypothetical protein JW935_24035 [candidate division KSB1 bacterium]|nr:hypothetical protein [candidate division KSB1 bacterium]
MISEYDTLEKRCPKLGHLVHFKYCRICETGLACNRIIKCWQTSIEVERYMQQHFSESELQKIFAPPKPKMTSILELIQKAQELKDEKAG